jgi:hypothetical protein
MIDTAARHMHACLQQDPGVWNDLHYFKNEAATCMIYGSHHIYIRVYAYMHVL